MVIGKIDSVMEQSTIELRCHNGSLNWLLVARINKIALLVDCETHKSNADSVFIEEDVRMRAEKNETGNQTVLQ